MSQELNPVRVYDSHYRGPCTSERGEQIGAIQWIEAHHPDRFPLVFHPANEQKAKVQFMELRRREGVKPGVSDIIDLGGTSIWRAGVFEMKRLDRIKSKTSRDQHLFLATAADNGCFSAICYGRDQFILAYLDFLSLSPLQSR